MAEEIPDDDEGRRSVLQTLSALEAESNQRSQDQQRARGLSDAGRGGVVGLGGRNGTGSGNNGQRGLGGTRGSQSGRSARSGGGNDNGVIVFVEVRSLISRGGPPLPGCGRAHRCTIRTCTMFM